MVHGDEHGEHEHEVVMNEKKRPARPKLCLAEKASRARAGRASVNRRLARRVPRRRCRRRELAGRSSASSMRSGDIVARQAGGNRGGGGFIVVNGVNQRIIKKALRRINSGARGEEIDLGRCGVLARALGREGLIAVKLIFGVRDMLGKGAHDKAIRRDITREEIMRMAWRAEAKNSGPTLLWRLVETGMRRQAQSLSKRQNNVSRRSSIIVGMRDRGDSSTGRHDQPAFR